MEDGQSWSLLELPPSFLLRCFIRLNDYKDIIALQSTCKSLLQLGRSSCVWSDRFEKDYGLRLQVTEKCDEAALQKLYRNRLNLSSCLRFWGVFTDGGCDEEQAAYWVDNAFVPNHWVSFCSERGKNVNCIGVLVEGVLERDCLALEERTYMIQRCKHAAAHVFNVNDDSHDDVCEKLLKWSTSELRNFLIGLYLDFEAGGILGAMLFIGISPTDRSQEQIKLQNFIDKIRTHSTLSSIGISRFDDDEYSLYSRGLFSAENFTDTNINKPLSYYDTTFTEFYRTLYNQRVVGVVESIELSRKGEFSCPVASGVIFIGQLGASDKLRTNEEIVSSLKQIPESEVSTALNDFTDIEIVKLAVEEQRLPNILSMGNSTSGQWIEFDGEAISFKNSELFSLKPVLWFHFYSREELEKQRQEHYESIPTVSGNQQHSLHDDEDAFSEDWTSEESIIPLAGELLDELTAAVGIDTLPQQNESETGSIIDEEDDMDEVSLEVAYMNANPFEEDKLTITLNRKIAGNIVLLKLIDQENRMEEFSDYHSNPNVDINSVGFTGKTFHLPDGVNFL